MRYARRSFVSAVVLVLSAGIGVVGCSSKHAGPQATVDAYLKAWNRGDFTAVAALDARTGDVDRADAGLVAKEVATDLGAPVTRVTAGAPVAKGDRATAPTTSTVELGAHVLVLHGTLSLVRVKGRWGLAPWRPTAISTLLADGHRFSVVRAWQPRAPILGAGGVSLTPDAAIVTVGVVGQRVEDPPGLTAALVAAGLDKGAVTAGLIQATRHPTQFTPVGILPEAAYEKVKPQIYPLPGTAFQKHTGRAPLSADLGAHLVGSVGPITAEELHRLGAPYTATSVVGQGGLEAAYEQRLAGSPSTSVTVVHSHGTKVASVAEFHPTPPKPLQTTIDPAVQTAAEGALAGVQEPSAIVAVRVSTGDVLASVSRPVDQPFDLAFDGELPPGSTFKVVTAAALLGKGATPSTPLTCPDSVTVDGRSFHNFEHETLGNLTLQQAFAQSCNTAFIGAAAGLGGSVLPLTAKAFGVGTTPHLGLAAFGGSVPTPTSKVELAATAIGQSKVLASPLAMADVAATVGSGSYRPPRLVAGAPDDKAAAVPLSPAVDAALRSFMGAVVTDGTASGANLPAGTFGKTGTAEFGGGVDPKTHAWFIGYRGDLAFAVLVEGGGVGGVVAAPIASAFLLAVPG